ncbi:MAG: hypothetical protein EAZ47_08635 [Bacteroidetes bacterium]|nr:MAG: hypothetical protein EAY72_07370 [Bacteroidota bacterium]TAE67748.1 MAG: hypothetical protein EAY68_05050 [Bacteroidota bacterium]TAF92543.1 MAG: hypothetical protein EAZ47_08635 [Bacteroidota bacterium]
MEIDKTIIAINDTGTFFLRDTQMDSMVTRLNASQNPSVGIQIFDENGIPNSRELFSLFGTKYTYAQTLVTTNTVFSGITQEEGTAVLMGSVRKYLANNSALQRVDECSRAYAVGMENCDDNFALGTAGSVLAGVGGFFAGGPIGAAGALSMSMATVYGAERLCRQNVVKNWRICRTR